jgi:hypothetical protein
MTMTFSVSLGTSRGAILRTLLLAAALSVAIASAASAQDAPRPQPTLAKPAAAKAPAAKPADAAAEATQPPADEPAPKADMAPTTSTGDVTFANYTAESSKSELNGVSVFRVTHRSELPGGPWAVGNIGDYIIENDQICAVVRGENRPGDLAGSGSGTGCIIDLALRDQMWDLLGGISQLARTEHEKVSAVIYDKIEIRKAEKPEGFPTLVMTGHLADVPDIVVVTGIGLQGRLSYLTLESHYINKGKEKIEIEVLDQVLWGALPPFIGGFGFPSYAKSYLDMKTHWICGALDDLGVAIVRDGPEPLDVARTQYNSSLLFYGGLPTEPKSAAAARRSVLVTRGDMAPVSEYAMRSKQFPFGYLQGTVTQESDGKPIAGATVEISQFNPFRAMNASPLPYLITTTDVDGKYRAALPEGGYVVTCVTPGRPSLPVASVEQKVRAGLSLTNDIKQADLQTLRVEAFDAETSAPLPAKLRLVPPEEGDRAVATNLGAPWRAQGGRLVYYLRPGANDVPILEGAFHCIVSRGLEYDIVEKDVTVVAGKQPAPLRVALRHLPLTKGMVSVDMNLATEASLGASRVSAEDVVLAAAGEGIEWIVSGDEGRATNLAAAIKARGLGKWLRASVGVRLSYQYRKLFGEFYVFPIPAATKAEALQGLAGPDTTPADFFKAVRKAFPGALISVGRPAYASTSYLLYNGMNADYRVVSKAPDFSPDFDAIEVFADRDPQPAQAARGMLNLLIARGQYKIPLAASRTPTLYNDEPGYPRTYLVTGEDDASKLQDKDLVAALREGRFFITSGPILEQTINGKWPVTRLAPPQGKYEHRLRILGAPWVTLRDVGFTRQGRLALPRFFLAADNRDTASQSPNILFPYDDDSAQPVVRDLEGHDVFTNIEVQADAVPILTLEPSAPVRGFAYTPPVLLDADGDGKYEFQNE